MFNAFCLLALVISSLGIFGLALFSISQRMKEISIRKVLGASVFNLLQLITKEYLILIAAASLIALPLAVWGIQVWLYDFSIKVELSAWFFFFPIIFILVVALFTVSGQALIAVSKNPIDHLKNE